MSEAEHRIPLEQDTPEYLVYAQYKINDNDPGRWRKVYVTAEYLLKHLPKHHAVEASAATVKRAAVKASAADAECDAVGASAAAVERAAVEVNAAAAERTAVEASAADAERAALGASTAAAAVGRVASVKACGQRASRRGARGGRRAVTRRRSVSCIPPNPIPLVVMLAHEGSRLQRGGNQGVLGPRRGPVPSSSPDLGG